MKPDRPISLDNLRALDDAGTAEEDYLEYRDTMADLVPPGAASEPPGAAGRATTAPARASSAPLVRAAFPTAGMVVAERYRIEQPLGEGGMGLVFAVRHLRLDKPFALKLIRTDLSDDRARQLFYREARLASSFAHPNIVTIVDFGEDAELGAFMVMELLDGETLSARLRAAERLPLKTACDVVLQIAEALHYIHGRQVVHLDIKPDNIFLYHQAGLDRRRFAVKLLDFGLAHPGGATSQQQHLDGTPEYLAPERIRGQSPQPSMDIYAIGTLFYELLAGRAPFEGPVMDVMRAHLNTPPRPLSELLGEPIEERAEALILRALSKRPEDRQKDIAAFLYELRTLMDMLGIGRRRGAPPPRHTKTDNTAERAGALGFRLCPVPLAAVDVGGSIVVANEAFAQFLTGDAQAKVVGTNLHATRLEELYHEVEADLRQVHVTGNRFRRVLRLVGPEGAPLRLAIVMVPGQPELGEVHLSLTWLDG